MKIFTVPETKTDTDLHTEELPVLDNGYFDVLVAIGYAALADAYYEGPSPSISLSPVGFKVTHALGKRERPNLSWLKYSLAASWKKEEAVAEGNCVKKDKVWDGEEVISHQGAVVDTSNESKITLELNRKTVLVTAPLRELYGVLNKLGSPKWFNACIHTCRERGLELLNNEFNEKISFNSVVLPQTSKGAMSSGSFSIANGSVPAKLSKEWSREICLAAAGLLCGARGSIQSGFALPVPKKVSFSLLSHLINRNRKRRVPNDFFFPYNNYLYYLRLLIAYGDKADMLNAVCGAKFIELGTQSSPAGVWSLQVPNYSYSLASIDDLNSLLEYWRQSAKPRPTSEPNIDRLAVDRLMRGFEKGEITAFVEGYLSYIDTVGFKPGYLPLLRQQQFYEIMNSSSKKFQALVEELTGPLIQPIIKLIRQDTYKKVFKPKDQKSEQPDYQMIRKLREVQNSEDLVTAICEISIKRSIDKFTSQNTSSNDREKHNMPTQEGIAKIIELSEDERYTPKLIAQLILALALSKETYTNN